MLGLALLLLWAQSPPTTDWMAEGTKALDEKRYDAAVEAFQKAVAADANDYGAQFNLALSYGLLKRDTEAIAGYRRVLELKPGLFEAELNLGIVLLRNGKPADAVPLLKTAADSRPKDPRPVSFLAEALLSSGQSADAETTFVKALEIDPKSASSEDGLARALMQLDRLPEAADHFRKAAALDPVYGGSVLRVAEAYEAKADREAALAIYEQFPADAGAQERSGQLLLGMGRPADAIPKLEAAVRLSPSSANQLALATAYMRTKQPDKSIAMLNRALGKDPNNYDMRMIAGRILRDDHKYPEAAGQFFAATKLKADSVEAWNELSGALVLAERYPEAIGALDKVRSLGAETGPHHYLRALCLDHLNQAKPALEEYRKFLETSDGKHPDEEFKARQRARILDREVQKR